MNRNLITVGVFASLILVAFGYIIFDFIRPEDALVDETKLPEITVLEMDDISLRKTGLGGAPIIEFEDEAGAREVISDFAEDHDLSIDDYPYYLVTRMVRNPELSQFVLYYPLNREANTDPSTIDCSYELETARNNVPLYIQWDERWGYTTYGSDLMGLTGCGPTCLSMVASSLLNDSSMNPLYMAQFSMEHGYYDYSTNSGTLWSLMTDGAESLGLTVNEVPAEESLLIEALESGHPVIAIMGPGDFTTEGHFIVLTGYENGYVTVNDPNSFVNSNEVWSVETIIDQANGMWEYSI